MRRILTVAVTLALSLTLNAVSARANPTGASVPPISVTTHRVSTTSPFPSGACFGDVDSSLNGNGYGFELEPTLTATPNGVTVAWMQDGYLGIVSASSADGGSTWNQVVPPGLADCEEGGNGLRVAHPRLVTDGLGTIFLSSAGAAPDAQRQVEVNVSRDGGKTWSAPTLLIPSPVADQPTLSADPADPKAVSVVWAARGDDSTWFARTDDDGVTWTVPRQIRITCPGSLVHNSLTTLPNGTLINVTTDNAAVSGAFDLPDLTGAGLHIHASRSLDDGATWTEYPIEDSSSASGPDDAGFPADPVVGPDGAAYLLFPVRDSGPTSWTLVRSNDGVTWSHVATVPLANGALIPDLAIASDSTIGILYDTSTNAGTRTDAWFTESRDGGVTWSSTHLGGPFDVNTIPNKSLGTYEELRAIGKDFAAVYALGASSVGDSAADGATDIFFASISTPLNVVATRAVRR
jgi:BNR repeat protein